jgi:hypothetical protein
MQVRAAFPDIFAVDSAGLEEGQRFLAKNSDHLADFDGDDTGGVLSGLLAEEDAFDRRALWRLGSWGFAAVAAVTVAVMASQTQLGWRRDQMATADLVQQANRLQGVARESQNEARRLAAALDTLNNDRDRLYSRVTVLEQGLDSVTGAIARQASPPAQPAETSQGPAPTVAPVATAPATPVERMSAAAGIAPANVSSITKDAPAKDAPSRPAVTPSTPLIESKSMMAPPDPAAGKLIEPSRPVPSVATEPPAVIVAAAPATENAEPDAADIALPKVQRTEFGVDVGGANSIPGLRALWRGLLKSRANAPLTELQPIMVIREGSGGRGMQFRLVAGPLGDAAAAAKLCAAMTENDRHCETAVYDGQRLTLKPDDAPAVMKPPAPSQKKNAQKRAAVEEPKKPEASSGWSSFLSKKLGQ